MISINEEERPNRNLKVIGGAVSTVKGAVSIVLALVGFLVIRQQKLRRSSKIIEEFDTIDDPLANSVTYQNALQNFEMRDDSFADNFIDH